MDALQTFNSFAAVINRLLDFIFLWGGLFVILQYPFRFFAGGMNRLDRDQEERPDPQRRRNGLRDLFTQSAILLAVTLLICVMWILPELIEFIGRHVTLWPSGVLSLYRWGLICVVAFILAFVFGHEHGESRWLASWAGHTAIIFLGLFMDGWLGLFFISLPVLAAYYFLLSRLALVLLPTAHPENPEERRKRVQILMAYAWGIQFPMDVVDDHAWKKPERRIPGDFTWGSPVPGLIWTKAHQVVGVTGGTTFKRVSGPGLVFLGPLERAEQVFDLRLQLRTNSIDVVTRDGISLKIVVFTGFRIDPETWSDQLYKKLRADNPLLRGAQTPDHVTGSFHFSRQRIRATIGVTSSLTGKPGELSSTLYWDQWALNVVEDQARKVVALKNLDELWRLPDGKDEPLANAMDGIAKQIKDLAEPFLRAKGILLVVSRVVNFNFPEENPPSSAKLDEISKQQLAIWGSDRESKRSDILVQAEAGAKNAQQQARADAASLMLKAIEEGLKTTHEIGLSPYITALLFSALQEYIDKDQDEEKNGDEKQNLKDLPELMAPHKDKEKKR